MKFYSGLSTPVINVMIRAVVKAARGLVRDFGELEQLQVSKKGLGDFVSVADHRSEDVLIQELFKARPTYNFLTEERGSLIKSDSDMCWIIDPLDGTINFLHGLPHFCIAVALKKGDETVAAVTYNPISDELFCSEKARGTYLNHYRIRVSNRRVLEESLLGIASTNHSIKLKKPINFRRSGSAALDLAYVACGRLDLFLGQGLHPWDSAGGCLLVLEAGGMITYNSKDTLLVSNAALTDSLDGLI